MYSNMKTTINEKTTFEKQQIDKKRCNQELLNMRVNSIKKWQMLSRQSQPPPINDADINNSHS